MQALALGLSTAWLIVPGNTIFLVRYGSGLLPVTYILAAVGGAAASVGLANALRRRPLVAVAATTLAGTALTLVAAWAMLRAGVEPAVFVILVLAPLQVPIGMMFVLDQAGLLLDVRTLKAFYARVVAGFALGFVAGGLSASSLLDALGRTEHLVLCAAGAMTAFLVVLLATRRRYHDELSTVERVAVGERRPTLTTLTRNRYVVLIVAFQMLSAIESQWLDFLVFDRAARRYDDSEQLAQFIGRFAAITYGIDIVFLLVIAGALLRWRGLKLGLTANPSGVALVLIVVLVTTALQSSGAAGVFALIVAARGADIVLCDGMVRPSISAGYQAVHGSLRTLAQTAVEGLAVPVAIGISGAALLVIGWAGAIDGPVLPLLTAAVVACWLVVSVALYRGYRDNLLSGLRQRLLVASDLTIEGANELSVVEGLIDSDDPGDVRLALDTLTSADHPDLSRHLTRLAADAAPPVRVDALRRLRRLAPDRAADVARVAAVAGDDELRSAAFSTLVAHGRDSDLELFSAARHDASEDVRVAAHAGIARFGGAAGQAAVTDLVTQLTRSPITADRVVAGRIIGTRQLPVRSCEPVLAMLLTDADDDVIDTALDAVDSESVPALFDLLVRHLGRRRTAAAAVAALARADATALELIDAAIADPTLTASQHELLIRVCRSSPHAGADEIVRSHVDHSTREVGLAALVALAAMPGAATQLPADRYAMFLSSELEHAAWLLSARVMFENDPATTTLRTALDEELAVVIRRITAVLSLRYGSTALDRVTQQLARDDTQLHAVALEWLDVTLAGDERPVVGLLDPGLSDRDRLRAVRRGGDVATSRADVLHDLIVDPERRWRRAWLQACAVHAAWDDPTISAVADNAAWQEPEPGILGETLTSLRARASAGTYD